MAIRRFSRMNMPILINYRIHISEPSEEVWISQGVLKNLSQGGAFFTCEYPPPLAEGNTGTFIISILSPSPDVPVGSQIVFQGMLKRIEAPAEGAAGFGVAVQFLSPVELVPKEHVFSGALKLQGADDLSIHTRH